jgi:hypothetical protein
MKVDVSSGGRKMDCRDSVSSLRLRAQTEEERATLSVLYRTLLDRHPLWRIIEDGLRKSQGAVE